MRFFAVAVIGLLTAISVAPAAAAPLDERAQREILADIQRRIAAELYDRDVAAGYIEALHQYAARDGFGAPMDAEDFALSVHRALHRKKIDFHLSIFGPARAAASASHDAGDDDSHGDGHDDDTSDFMQVLAEENGVKLVKFDVFDSSDAAIARMYEVFREVAGARGVIFDLRGNLGGDALHARLMFGCLLAEPQALYSIDIPHGEHKRLSRYRSEHVDECAPLGDMPLAVLVDHNTASTAELFAMVLQNRARAVIVGEPTLGGAHAAEFFPLAHDFGMMLPIGYVRDALTGADWEGDGVVPDIAVKPVAARMHAVDAIEKMQACGAARWRNMRECAGAK